jgi:hypothetical protein
MRRKLASPAGQPAQASRQAASKPTESAGQIDAIELFRSVTSVHSVEIFLVCFLRQ